MQTETIILAVALAATIALFIWHLLKTKAEAEAAETTTKKTTESVQLQLAAYERVLILAERTKLDALVNRNFQPQLTAGQLEQLLVAQINEEYDHNVSQQIYITADMWTALLKCKEQNLFIINQLAATLPPNAGAAELGNAILQYTTSNPNGTMNKMVQTALQFEAKKLL
jgi:hypothetical protein